jgi:hypothetical protein
VADESKAVDVSVLSEIVQALNRLDVDSRQRMLESLMTLYGLAPSAVDSLHGDAGSPRESKGTKTRDSFSEDRSMSAKEFVWYKQPRTAIERVVCLAYYLTHYRGMKQFKTSDITSLNMEAAQVRFSNPTMMVGEATRHGYLVPAGGQNKQLSVIGEQFVRLLPDRNAAVGAIKNLKPRRPRRKETLRAEEQQTT